MKSVLSRCLPYLGIALLGLWSFPGNFTSSDGEDRYRVGHAILTQGLPDVSGYGDSVNRSEFRDDQGTFRSYFGLGQSLLFIPMDIPGTLLTGILDLESAVEFKMKMGLTAAIHLVVILWLLFWAVRKISRELELPEPVSLFAAVTAVFGTLNWSLARAGQEEPWLAVLLVLALGSGLRFQREGRPVNLAKMTAFLSAGLLFRPSFLTVVLIGAAWSFYLIRASDRQLAVRLFSWWSLAAVCIGTSYFFWNLYRTGNGLNFGYGQAGGTFSGRFLTGFIQPVMGTDKGVIWTTPWVLPGLILVIVLWRRLSGPVKTAGLLFLILLTANLLFHSTWFLWAGDNTYGARFQAHLFPVAAILFWAAFDLALPAARQVVMKGVVVLIVLLQIPSITFWETLEYLQCERGGWTELSENGSPTGALGQISMRYQNIVSKAATGQVFQFSPPGRPEPFLSDYAATWNFWPWTVSPCIPETAWTPLFLTWLSLPAISFILIVYRSGKTLNKTNGVLI